MANPVKTVAETIDHFYTEYPQPPLLPMYRPFIIDFLQQVHLAAVDSRFKYDVVFALGVSENFNGLMNSYDKMVGPGEQSAKIFTAFAHATSMEPDTIKADAEALLAYAKASSPAQILKNLEGTEAAPDSRIAEAFSGIGKQLYTFYWSVGLFKVMETSGVEISKANVEEWAKALKIQVTRVTGDLETYKQNKMKLQKAEEMLREVEIREKKKLAERLEAKAKALSAKAAAKTEEAAPAAPAATPAAAEPAKETEKA